MQKKCSKLNCNCISLLICSNYICSLLFHMRLMCDPSSLTFRKYVSMYHNTRAIELACLRIYYRLVPVGLHLSPTLRLQLLEPAAVVLR